MTTFGVKIWETDPDAAVALVKLRELVPAVTQHGGVREKQEQGNNVTLLRRGNSDTYLLRRLKGGSNIALHRVTTPRYCGTL
jgi:hypothetical protein